MNIHSDTCFKNENQLNHVNYSVNLVDKVALPIHIQNLEKALNLNSFLKQVHSFIDDKRDDKLNLTISKQQSKDVKASMYSFNKTGKNKNWLKNILIDNSDDSDDDIGEEVEQLLKIRKNFKKTSKINANISSNLLSLGDSIPLNTLFKNEKTCKNQIKKKKTQTTSKKKLKTDDPIKTSDRPIDENDKLNKTKEDDKYQLTNFFEPTLNSKSFNKHENDLIDTSCIDSKLLDDIKYEFALPDDQLQSESNMNDFVNSFLTNMNDQIVYSNQLPDEIFETEEEEISNGFSYDVNYDLRKLNKLTNQEEIIELNKINEIKPTIDLPIETFAEPISENEQTDKKEVQLDTIHLTDGSTVKIVNSTSINQNILTNAIVTTPPATINLPTINTQTTSSTVNSLSSSTNSSKTIESFDAMKFTDKIGMKKKEKPNKSLLEIEPEQLQNKRRKLWSTIVKKEIPRAYKSRLMNRKEVLNNCKKLATCCQRERKHVIGIPKLNRERSKKSNKEMATYKRNEQDLTKQLLPNISECNTVAISECNQG